MTERQWKSDDPLWVLERIPGFFAGYVGPSHVRVGYQRTTPGEMNQAIVPAGWITERGLDE